MNQLETLTGFIAGAIQQHKMFAVWFMPESPVVYFSIENKSEPPKPFTLQDLGKAKGFVFYPFDSNQSNPLILPSSEHFQGFEAMQKISEGKFGPELALPEKPADIQTTDKEDYLCGVQTLIGQINNQEAQKVVLSKIKIVPGIRKISPAELFLQLKATQFSAFCWMFFSPESSLWLGATPELLLRTKGNKYQTMALAGTRKSDEHNPFTWPEKERQEQQFVTDFIINQLKNAGAAEFVVSQPYTSFAGTMEHIRTDIEFAANKLTFGRILHVLHPTPAVCGLPKENALAMIARAEKHRREYYTGCVGPVNFEHDSAIFVNLRCMKIWKNHFQLFTGGGITQHSNPEAEWEETELKTRTMLNIIHNQAKNYDIR
jgi:isochorismate synthase